MSNAILDMPLNCRQIVVSFNKSFSVFPSTNDVQRYCRYHKLEIVTAETQMGSYIITVKKQDNSL
jgi:hypothetical protein